MTKDEFLKVFSGGIIFKIEDNTFTDITLDMNHNEFMININGLDLFNLTKLSVGDNTVYFYHKDYIVSQIDLFKVKKVSYGF